MVKKTALSSRMGLSRTQTKGTVLLVCLRCVDIHWSCVETCRRYVPTLCAICALAYCGRHESSHIIKAHTDSTRRLFVEICVNSRLKNLCKKNCVNNEICGFKASHKFSRIICGLNGVFLNDFTYLCLYAFQKPFVS